MTALAFLHTAEVHIAGFERLIQAQAPGLRVHHAVAALLLEQARRLGTDDPGVRAALQQTLTEMARSSGARLLVCTCSTLGALAEQVDGGSRFPSVRIDRPMAERALALGSRVLLLAALASMAPLSERLAGLGPPLLASPVLGVQWALAQPELQGLTR